MMEILRYYMFDFWEIESDQRISRYPLMSGGPWAAWTIIAAYVYFVKRLGPVLMKNRQPFQLSGPIIIYNTFMILINSYFFYEIMVTFRWGIDLNIYNFERINKPTKNPLSEHACWLSWLYLMSKYLDLIETIFFVLRKKFNQISNLHVYHHSVVPILVHMFIKVSPEGGPGAMFPLLNTFIHIIMYTYYTLAALGLHKYIWWKKYVTQLQLGQFVIFGFYGLYFFLNQKGYPSIFTYLGIIQPLVFFSMFYSFYKRSYDKNNKLKIDQQQQHQQKQQESNEINKNETHLQQNGNHQNGSIKMNNGQQPNGINLKYRNGHSNFIN